MSDASDAAAMYAKECADLRARLAAAESERNEAKRTEDLHGEHDAEIIDRLRAELEAARRQIDDARKDGYAIGLMDAKDMLSDTESPIAWQYRDKNSDWHTINLVRNKHQRDYLEKNSDRYELRPLYAAPVPPQPSAVPEAVAILVQALEEIAWQRPLGVRPSKSSESMERAAITALHKYNDAILSAADDEVKNG